MQTGDGFLTHYTGLCVGAVFYGFFLISLVCCARAFIRRKQGKWWMYTVGSMLFVLVTLDIALAMIRLQKIVQHCRIPSSVEDGSCNPMQWCNVIRTFIVALASLLTEGTMIYRCWMVLFSQRTIVGVPVILWCSGFGMMTYTTYEQSKPEAAEPHGRVVESVHKGFWATTIVMNIITTGLVVHRIRTVEKRSRSSWDETHSSLNTFRAVIRNVVESGLICTAASIFMFVSQFTRKQNPLASTLMILASGISFNLLIVRAERQQRQKEKEEALFADRVSGLRFEKCSIVTVSTAISTLSGKMSLGTQTSSTSVPEVFPKAHLKPEP